MTQVRRSVGRHLQRVFTVSAIRNPQIAEEKKSLMDGKKSAAVRAMAVLREAAGATSLNWQATLPIDPEASRERFATCRQPHGNREGPTFLSVGIGRKESRPSSWRRWGVFLTICRIR